MNHKMRDNFLLQAVGLWLLAPAWAHAVPALADPTRPPAFTRAAPTPAVRVVGSNADTAMPVPVMPSLQSLHVSAQDEPSALVDGRVVRVGDRLGETTVVVIDKQGILLRGPRYEQRIALVPGGGKTASRTASNTTNKTASGSVASADNATLASGATHHAASTDSGCSLKGTPMIAKKIFLGLLVCAGAGAAAAVEPARALAPAGALGAAQPGAGAENRFDLSVNNAPATQVFMQLGSGTPYNMLVSPEVTGNVTITLKDTTLLEAMESMRELFGYDFRVAGNRIFVQPNTVQTRLFKINYLPGRREGASDIRVTSSSITQPNTGGSTTSGASGSATGSSTPAGSNGNPASGGGRNDTAHIRTTSDADFWREVRESLVSMVGSADQRSVVLNPAAGVIVVRATPAELRQVGAYLKAMQINIQRQVMIEAKIVSVELSEGSQAGVNWGAFGNVGNDKLSFGAAAPGATLGPRGSPLSDGINTITAGAGLAANALGAGFYGLAFQASNFAAMLNFLESQGNVQVLSSPRIATLNNQKAILKVGNDELFVTGVSSSTTSSAVSAVTSPTLVLQPFFSGVALDVTPQIDEAGNVMLHVHPTVSNVTEKQKNIDLGTLGSFRLPLATSAVSETDSIVRVRDGQIVAIGGLMTQAQRDDRSGLPGLKEVPIIGALFRQKTGSMSKRELVILIKPSVIGEEGPWPDADPSLSGAKR